MASREPLIEPYRPHDSAASHEYDYDDDYDYDVEPEGDRAPDAQGRVLWGRVAILAGALLLAFIVGRAGAPNGIPEEDLRAARAETRAAEEEADQLREQIATLEAETQGVDEEKATGSGRAAQDEEAAEPAAENEVYLVQGGDTLSKIAEKFYGNAALDDFLAEANPDVNPLALRVGQEIIIPPKPKE